MDSKSTLTRRELLALSAGLTAGLLEPVRAVAAAAKPVRIRDIETFRLNLPASPADLEISEKIGYGVNHVFRSTSWVVKITTDVGVTGYSFAGYPPDALPQLRRILAGQDLFAVERHLQNGLERYGGAEHAVWDAIGKIAGLPVYRLLGGSATSVKPYLTLVWRGKLDQSHVSYDEQAAMALKVKQAGFKGIKIRAWRPNPLDDAEACGVIRSAVGPDFAIMFDRTARMPESVGQKTWDYETALKVARALEKHSAYWLEEPFAREDYQLPARLAAAVEIPITGGEGYRGLGPFRQCVVNQTYDILQPDGVGCGGIFNCRKVATLAQAFGFRCVLHGIMALSLAGWIQANLAIGSEWQEFGHIIPPVLPQEQWAPSLKVLKSAEVFPIRDGAIQAPEYPGIGLDVDEEAISRFRVRA
jgi:L-alanine-DL-glutamate epimerase-like enolase superfamily enzyme